MGGFRVDDEVNWRLCVSCFMKAFWWALIIQRLLIVHRFIYTGSVDITLDIAQDLLRAADQYLLEGLKRLCEYTIAQVTWHTLSLSVHVLLWIEKGGCLITILLFWHRMYHWRMFQTCMNFQKPSMQCH